MSKEAQILTEEQLQIAVNDLLEAGKFLNKYNGNDNGKRPKTDYLKKIISMSDDSLLDECKDKIWLSAYASNNPRSDYHWQCDACYDESKRRNKTNIYSDAHTMVLKNN